MSVKSLKLDSIQILKDVFEIDKNRYSKAGDYSATEIYDPPRLVQLMRRYKSKIVEKPSQKLDSLLGVGLHLLFETNLEKFNKEITNRYELETQFCEPFMVGDDIRTLSGRFDICTDGVHIIDIKTAKVWKRVFDPELDGWTKQQNIYAYLASKQENREPIESIKVLIFYKDWNENQLLRAGKKFYPKEPAEMLELDLWSTEQQYEYIMDRLSLHFEHEETPDKKLPACTPDEMWARFDDQSFEQFAYFKNGLTARATKILHDATNLPEAIEIAKGIKGCNSNSIVEIRHPQRKRCEKFCSANAFCNIYQEYKKKIKNKQLNDHFEMKEVL